MLPKAILVLVALFAAAPAVAQDRVIRFGLTGDYPPFAQRQLDGGFTGADIVMARRVAAALHARAEFVQTSWATLVTDFSGGRFDVAIGGLTVTPERAAVGTYSVRLLEDGKRPLSRCSDLRRYRSDAGINRPGVRVQVAAYPGLVELARERFPAATVSANPVEADLIPALLERRTDVWVLDGVAADLMVRRYRGRLCATTLKPFTHVDKAWLIRRDPQLVADIDRVLKRLIADGSWRRAIEAVH